MSPAAKSFSTPVWYPPGAVSTLVRAQARAEGLRHVGLAAQKARGDQQKIAGDFALGAGHLGKAAL
jgi:hypothetical protein